MAEIIVLDHSSSRYFFPSHKTLQGEVGNPGTWDFLVVNGDITTRLGRGHREGGNFAG